MAPPNHLATVLRMVKNWFKTDFECLSVFVPCHESRAGIRAPELLDFLKIRVSCTW